MSYEGVADCIGSFVKDTSVNLCSGLSCEVEKACGFELDGGHGKLMIDAVSERRMVSVVRTERNCG